MIADSREGRVQQLRVLRFGMWLFVWILLSLGAMLGMAVSLGYDYRPLAGALLGHAPMPVLCAVLARRIRMLMERDGQD